MENGIYKISDNMVMVVDGGMGRIGRPGMRMIGNRDTKVWCVLAKDGGKPLAPEHIARLSENGLAEDRPLIEV